jgi:hypothetical protein
LATPDRLIVTAIEPADSDTLALAAPKCACQRSVEISS